MYYLLNVFIRLALYLLFLRLFFLSFDLQGIIPLFVYYTKKCVNMLHLAK